MLLKCCYENRSFSSSYSNWRNCKLLKYSSERPNRCFDKARRRRKGGGGDSSDPLLEQVEQVYRRAVLTRRTQSLVLLGRSGAGKSCNLKHSLAYLVQTTINPDLQPEPRYTCKLFLLDLFVIGYSKNFSLFPHLSLGRPKGGTVHSHCGESFAGLIQRYVSEGWVAAVAVIWGKTQFFWTTLHH